MGRILVVGIAVGLFILGWVPLILSSRLPEQLAVAWDAHGNTTSTSTQYLYLPFWSVAVLVCSSALAVVVLAPEDMASTNRHGWAALLASLGAIPIAWIGPIFWANHGHIDPSTVSDPGDWFLVGLAAAGGLFFFVSWIAPRGPALALDTTSEARFLDVDDGSQVSWSRRFVERRSMAIGITMLILAAISNVRDLTSTVLALVVAASALHRSQFVVFADRRGLTIRYGAVSWPRTNIPIEAIESASSLEVKRTLLTSSPEGLLGNEDGRVRVPGSRSVVRNGPALIVRRTNGEQFMVTVDDPETAAAVLNREVARQSTGAY